MEKLKSEKNGDSFDGTPFRDGISEIYGGVGGGKNDTDGITYRYCDGAKCNKCSLHRES